MGEGHLEWSAILLMIMLQRKGVIRGVGARRGTQNLSTGFGGGVRIGEANNGWNL